MKNLIYTVVLLAMLGASSCKKKSEDPAPLQNAWTFKADSKPTEATFTTKTITLNIQGYGMLRSISNDRAYGGLGGISSTLTIYFKGMPLVDKTYKITSLSRINTHDDECAIEEIVYADPEFSTQQMVWTSDGDGGQTLNYKFSNSKGSAEFSKVALYNGTQSRISGITSGNISQ